MLTLPTQGKVIMTQDELSSDIDSLHYCLDQLLQYQDLIRISKEISDKSKDKRFKRISLLLSIYEADFECQMDSMNAVVCRLYKHLVLQND